MIGWLGRRRQRPMAARSRAIVEKPGCTCKSHGCRNESRKDHDRRLLCLILRRERTITQRRKDAKGSGQKSVASGFTMGTCGPRKEWESRLSRTRRKEIYLPA